MNLSSVSELAVGDLFRFHPSDCLMEVTAIRQSSGAVRIAYLDVDCNYTRTSTKPAEWLIELVEKKKILCPFRQGERQ
jgi:hypothetical protein